MSSFIPDAILLFTAVAAVLLGTCQNSAAVTPGALCLRHAVCFVVLPLEGLICGHPSDDK